MKTWIKNVLLFIGCILVWMCLRYCIKGTVEPLLDSVIVASGFAFGMLAMRLAFQKSKCKEKEQ